jgi:hypothetical protein
MGLTFLHEATDDARGAALIKLSDLDEDERVE